MSNATPDSRTTPLSPPSQLPRGPLPSAAQASSAADICVNFNLPDLRVVCLSVPVGINALDADFIMTMLQAHVTGAVRRGR